MWRRVRAAILAGGLTAGFVLVGTTPAALAAGAMTLPHACGPGVLARWCPPLCVKVPASEVARAMHTGRLSGPVWHTDGVAEDYCTYSANQDASVQISVDGGATVPQFEEQLKADRQFFPKATFQDVPAMGKYAVSYVDCNPVLGCYPSLLVLSKGYLVGVSDQLTYANMATTVHRYLPMVEGLVKAVLAKVPLEK